MANGKKITRADTITMESFVLPQGDARNKGISQEAIANLLGTKQSTGRGFLIDPAVQSLNTIRRHPGQVYSYGGRDYASFEDAKRANPDMPLVNSPPSVEQEDRAKARKAFLDSIGAGPFGLGPIVYDLGGGADAINSGVELDKAVGGLIRGGGARGADKIKLPVPSHMAPLTKKF